MVLLVEGEELIRVMARAMLTRLCYAVLEARAGVHSEWPQAFLGKPYKAKDLREAIVRILANPTEASRS